MHQDEFSTDVRLTIALPVYNGGGTLTRVLIALGAQSWSEYVLLIGDNGSTDETQAICQRFAAADPRIRYHRRDSTIPAPANFRNLLEVAATPYFMFAAADDYLGPDFVQANITSLEADDGAVLSCSRTILIGSDGIEVASSGTFSLTSDALANIRSFLRNPGDNSRFYGVHRTKYLRAGFDASPIVFGFDWLTLIPGLLGGKHLEQPEAQLWRQRTPVERYRNWVLQLEPNVLGRIIPNLRMTMVLWGMLPEAFRWSLLPAILRQCFGSLANSPYEVVRAGHSIVVEIFGKAKRAYRILRSHPTG